MKRGRKRSFEERKETENCSTVKKTTWYIFRLKQIIVTVHTHMSLGVELKKWTQQRVERTKRKNQKAKSIFGGNSSNYSLLFSYFSHCFPLLNKLIHCFHFVFSLWFFYSCSFFKPLNISRVSCSLCKKIYTHRLCVCMFLHFPLVYCYFCSNRNPFPFWLTIAIILGFWKTYSVVIIQVPMWVKTCPFEIHLMYFPLSEFHSCT